MLSSIYLFFNLGGGEIMVVLLVVLLFFGSNKIPEFAKGLGKGIRQFKDAADGIQKDIQNSASAVKNDLDINNRSKDSNISSEKQDSSENKQQTT